MRYQITDWNDAYANGTHIPGADGFVERWPVEAAAFRASHPPQALGRGYLWQPAGKAHGLVVFIHGGWWMKFSPDDWSHLAAGPLAAGWAVAMPAYTLAPAARITEITVEVAQAITDAADRVSGPIIVTGHSAGGHLAARMICDDGTLPDAVAARIRHCVPISPLTDMRPFLRLAVNDTLRVDLDEALRESPALLTPREGIPMTCWVGGMERPEFIRQAKLLANIWAGLGAATDCIVDPGRHHFDVLDGLCDADSALVRTLLV